MTVSRRDFLLAGSALAASTLTAGRLWARAGQPFQQPSTTRQVNPSEVRYFEWKKAADRAHVAFGEGGNSLVVLGKDGAVLVDTKNAGFGETLRNEAAALGSPLALVINTHHHADHTGGNSEYTRDLPVLAHTKAKPRIAANTERYVAGAKGTVSAMFKNPKLSAKGVRDAAMKLAGRLDETKDPAKLAALFEPTRTTDGNEKISAGGLDIELTHVGAGHTDNDLILFFPALNLLHTGDLVFNRWWPYVDRGAGANSDGWIRSCEKILAICNDKTVVVPGHGEITDRAGVQAQIDFFRKVRDAAAKAVAGKVSRDDFIKQPFDDFKAFSGLPDNGQIRLRREQSAQPLPNDGVIICDYDSNQLVHVRSLQRKCPG
jgi:glyoxylase-like metal-dependent hydrolase (beta-lactamase superfamily II)